MLNAVVVFADDAPTPSETRRIHAEIVMHIAACSPGARLPNDVRLETASQMTLGEYAMRRLHALDSHPKQASNPKHPTRAPELFSGMFDTSDCVADIECDIQRHNNRHRQRTLHGGLQASPVLPHLTLAQVTACLFVLRNAIELPTDYILPHGQSVVDFASDYFCADLMRRRKARHSKLAQNQQKDKKE